ncbi:MAG: hypothetical protein IPP18_17970 [Rhodocyclaceae bacterium]|nr:hypothetical protein [Rhodocyclaceae bacterium]MBK6553233.1 hypothetical protein [Rhodocyclaceae bacterium]MBK9311750.1 hypothetical protein [Rhodocyclaceae bacterium]MBK9956894.1 hypothetical protein [Rhodocyclaceae bacterium]
MILQQMPPFLNVVASGVATLRIPRYAMTLTRLVLRLGGTTFTKAMIADIKIKIGPRTVWNCTGPRIDAINAYKGVATGTNFLTIDFTERDATGDVRPKEVGGFDLTTMNDDVTVEVTIAGATAPALSAIAFMTPPQGNPLIQKLVYVPASSAVAGKFPVQIFPRGALIKRVHFFYGGTDWGAAANGNMNRLEVKKSGLVIWDAECLEARFMQGEYRKVPQSKLYVYDPIMDNNVSGLVTTADAASMEFNAYLAAADTLNCYVELLDLPGNI